MLERQIASTHDVLGTEIMLSAATAGGKRARPTAVGIADVKYVELEHPTEGNIYVP